MVHTKYRHIQPYVTKDRTLIRELLHPAIHGAGSVSLAEAVVLPGETSQLHRHMETEEIYHITHGKGRMALGTEAVEVEVGDTVLIPRGTSHRITNTGEGGLHILCICLPPYSHGDTELL